MKFLVDEDLTRRIQVAVWHRNAAIDIVRVGDAGAPPYESSDRDVLLFAEQTGRMVITEDKHTMRGPQGHIAQHLAQGNHTWGVAFVRPYTSLAAIADAIVLLAEASTAEEWRDQELWIPFD
jgi:hypothetical protein